MAGTRAKELHVNPLTAPPRPAQREGLVPHWKVWRFSIANPGVSPWRDDAATVSDRKGG